ncbi:hypothetical protein AQUCO_01100362v1 [Aquilegia coerulea]|uniref:Uncharacterized protein n=1 Tax=Aquilegia coerulea TaxID=218851 RepID=A0A2G5E7E0_AQUCA|nr:hypothetical protein AQUCO_01100362v1 [Aquilegia coerulea]
MSKKGWKMKHKIKLQRIPNPDLINGITNSSAQVSLHPSSPRVSVQSSVKETFSPFLVILYLSLNAPFSVCDG